MNSEWQSLQPQTQQELKNTMNAMQPPQSIEEIKAGLETTEKGGVRQSIRNCLTVFQRDPLLSGAIAYNILTDRKDIIKPIGFHRESTALNDTDMKYLLLYLEETYGLTNEKKIDNAIGIVANENKYHPIRDYLSSLVWDGKERIRFCLRHFLGADADDYTYEALKLFLLGAISRAFQPGCKFEIMLCLVGGQGAGKSTFFRLLAVRDEWFSDDLRKLDDDNVYRKLQGHWIIEMSEMMATANAKSIEEIKEGLETTEKGGVRQSIRNCLTVFQRDPLLSGAIAYNILTDRKDIIKPIGFHRESTALNDTDMKYLLLYLEETYGLTNEKKIDNAIGIVANENKYHPIRDYLNTLVWDGTERIRFCLRHFLRADADDYTYEALKLFLLGAISRAFQPGCKFEIMLCLVGGQGAGKSTFFRLLAVRDEWFSDDLRKLDDDNVYRKLQGHWMIEMSEMMATANAKSIEEIKSFLSRQKEVYKIPYETHPADRPRQCVFGGTSNALDFLPLDRSGNRRFIPVMVYPEQAEVHILEDEAASRAYIEQMWAEAMEIYRSGRFKLAFSPAMQRYLKEHQRDFMPEDTKAGMIQAYLDKYTGSMVCSKQLYKEALNHTFDEPKQWEIREINEIMNQCITGWRYFPNPRMFSEYGRQKGWERENPATDSGNPSEKTMAGFVEVTEQMELPF